MSHENNTREITDYLNDINDSIIDISNFIANMTFEEFESDKKTQYAVVHCLEVIGEAVKKIPTDLRNQYPHIPWKEIAGMRDVIIHQYFSIDLDLLWETISKDILDFEKKILKIKGDF